MSTATDLLRQIQREPSDRDLRLVYADAVQDEGTADAEEVAAFARACIAGERPKYLPMRYREGIERGFLGKLIYWDCSDARWGHVVWADRFTGAVRLFGCTLTLINGFFAAYNGPAVRGWDDLNTYLTKDHVIRYGFISDHESVFHGQLRVHRKFVDQRICFVWGGRWVEVDERNTPLIRDHGRDRLRYLIPQDVFFRSAWPEVKWEFLR